MIIIHGEIHSSKNSRQIVWVKGSPRLLKSTASKADEEMLRLQLLEQKETWERMRNNCAYPYTVNFVFTRKTKRRWDFANLVQGVADAMVKAGYLPDDDVNHFIPVLTAWNISREDAGVRFWINTEGD